MNDHFRGLLLELTKILDKDHTHILAKLDTLINKAEQLKYPFLTITFVPIATLVKTIANLPAHSLANS